MKRLILIGAVALAATLSAQFTPPPSVGGVGGLGDFMADGSVPLTGNLTVTGNATVGGVVSGDGSGLFNVTAALVPVYSSDTLIVTGTSDPSADGTYTAASSVEDGRKVWVTSDGANTIDPPHFYVFLPDDDETVSVWYNTNSSPWLGEWTVNLDGYGAARVTVAGLEGAEADYNGVYLQETGLYEGWWSLWNEALPRERIAVIAEAGNGDPFLTLSSVVNGEGIGYTHTYLYGATNSILPWDAEWSTNTIDRLPDFEQVFEGAEPVPTMTIMTEVPTVTRDFAEGSQYLVRTGILPMTGNLNMGGQSITNVSSITVTNITYAGEYWEDTQVPALGIIPGATAPGLISFRTNDLLKIYGFDGAGAADYAYFTVQLSHRYKEGTPLHPHVHWCRTADPDDPANTNVVWRLIYSLGTPLGEFGLSVTNTITNGVAVANWTHQISSFTPITNETFGISGIMVGTITRVSGDAGDTYTPDAGFLGFDLHFQVDSPGSLEESSK